jgi:hypothetical protein
MTAARFCPTCGAARIEGARFCGGCGADLAAPGVPTAPVAPNTELQEPPVIEVPPAPQTVVRPAKVATTPVAGRSAVDVSRPTRDEWSARRRGPLMLVALVAFLVMAAGVGVGAVLLLRQSSGSDQAAGSPSASLIVLTSPSASQVPVGLADPITPAYQTGSGFTPDAVRVLTVTVLRLSLEQYKSANGTYPPDLAALFPAFAPNGPDGKPMAGPPASADGYAYSASGTGYTLAVVLTSGQSYTTSNPTEPAP